MEKNLNRYITLKHLLIESKKKIGIQFYSDKIIQLAITKLDGVKWSNQHKMPYVDNNRDSLGQIFDNFKGIAWVNSNYLYDYKPINATNGNLILDNFRNKKHGTGYRKCPEEFLKKLELKQYAHNTAKTYISMFEKFINHYKEKDLIEIDVNDIRNYLSTLIYNQKSISYQNQMVNSIKFYYETVLGMPNRFYEIERPRKFKKLPKVISKEEVKKMIAVTTNIKHKCVISLLYSAGLRRSELLQLKVKDIDSKRMVVVVQKSKGNKGRITLLSKTILKYLRLYYLKYRPKVYLFEGVNGGPYSSSSVLNIVKKASSKAKIGKVVTPHMLRHSFATHLLESGTNLRYIQVIMGHNSSKTTEIYTLVATNNIKEIKNPLD